jgi:hypothetical protein
MMDDRRKLARELDDIQTELKELEIRYEQYFSGLERREPYQDREKLARRLRQFTNRHIVWTDLKFRYQNLATRFMTYGQHWDRILRLIEEGKYERHMTKLKQSSRTKKTPSPLSPDQEANQLHQELNQARQAQGFSGDAPSKEKVASFLSAQREKIRDRYGDQPIQFSVDTSGNKPRIKVSLKK